ncbi:MAG: GFA family protein [Candidatus Binatia bacterium]
MLKTYKGSCHCGVVRFEAEIDLSAATYRCNCSICSRTRFWPAVVKPEAFHLLSGETELTKYLFNSKRNEHYFCKRCGVRSFGIGNTPDGERIYGVNLGCLEDATSEELAAAPIVYIDGKNDRQSAPPITSYL